MYIHVSPPRHGLKFIGDICPEVVVEDDSRKACRAAS